MFVTPLKQDRAENENIDELVEDAKNFDDNSGNEDISDEENNNYDALFSCDENDEEECGDNLDLGQTLSDDDNSEKSKKR